MLHEREPTSWREAPHEKLNCRRGDSQIAGQDGGAERDRTADLVNAIHALSQLSYGP